MTLQTYSGLKSQFSGQVAFPSQDYYSCIVGLMKASQDMFYIYASLISLMFLFLHPEFIRFWQATQKNTKFLYTALHTSKHNEHYTLQQRQQRTDSSCLPGKKQLLLNMERERE